MITSPANIPDVEKVIARIIEEDPDSPLADLFKDSFVMKTVVVNLPSDSKSFIGEKTTHDGKNYEVIWQEKGDWEADGKHWNTMLRLKFLS